MKFETVATLVSAKVSFKAIIISRDKSTLNNNNASNLPER